jgi:hypothetical protein
VNSGGFNESIAYRKYAFHTIFNSADRWVRLITVSPLTTPHDFEKAEMSSIPAEVIMRIGGFVAGTLIHTRESLRPIEQIKVGDYVLSKPESGLGEPSYQRVMRTFEHENREVFLVSWSILDSPIPWPEQEPAFVVVTGTHPIWVKRFVDRSDKGVKEVNAWMSIEEIYIINFEFNVVQNKAGVDVDVELHDGRVAQLGSVKPLLQSRDQNIGVGFKDTEYWGENYSGPEVRFLTNGPVVAKQSDGLFSEVGLDIHDAIGYDHYPERSLIRRSEGFLPMQRKVFNFEVETNHTYFVGKTGILVHNASGIGPDSVYALRANQPLHPTLGSGASRRPRPGERRR